MEKEVLVEPGQVTTERTSLAKVVEGSEAVSDTPVSESRIPTETFILVGAGAVAIGFGAYCSSKAGTGKTEQDPHTPAIDQPNVEDDRETIAIALYAVGGVLIVSGAGILFYNRFKDKEEKLATGLAVLPKTTMVPTVLPSGVGLAVEHSF